MIQVNSDMSKNYHDKSTDRIYEGYSQFVAGSNGPFPIVPVEFPKLQEMSLAELKILQDDTNKQEEFLNELPELIHLTKLKNEYIMKNEELARENLQQQQVLEDMKNKIIFMVQEANMLKLEFEHNSENYERLADAYSLSSVLDSLQVATMEAEEESDKIADHFLNGQLKVDEFLLEFSRKRVLYHQRQAKKEKLSQSRYSINKSY
ncbi:vacuolar protein sorting-associated protein 37A-like [Centruroides sculpturatus]|uniref:vacuolar protein sorting-associated protein 37A-like n=1 Tax=Centruroides sculpturatus TaxID=218467 RepID=UPI000C6CCB96|nr:vacuolar protein sorting-associated protein 37A-like [Centruroides sculpturatus]